MDAPYNEANRNPQLVHLPWLKLYNESIITKDEIFFDCV